MTTVITPKKVALPLKVQAPASKSHTVRALILSAFAKGKSRLSNLLISEDAKKLIEALEKLGTRFEWEQVKREDCIFSELIVTGNGGVIEEGSLNAFEPLDLGNSGIALRFLSALTVLSKKPITLTGDVSLCSRPMGDLLDALRMLGAKVQSNKEKAPCTLSAPLSFQKDDFQSEAPLYVEVEGKESQPVSALLFLGAQLSRPLEIHIKDPGEKPWVALSLKWLDRLGIRYKNEDFRKITVFGEGGYKGFCYTAPADFSSISYPLVAAILTRSHLVIEGLDFSDSQGDKALIDLLQEMGADIRILKNSLEVFPTEFLEGRVIDVNPIIDTLPLLAVIGCFAKGKTHLFNGAIARTKECDRIEVIAQELKKMGADIEVQEDGLIIREKKLTGAFVDSHKDQRIALALSIAALKAEGKTHLANSSCVEKTYPNFFKTLFFSCS